jgi:Primase C terminal 2 (PriCT-2)
VSYPGPCVDPQTIIDAAPPEPEKVRRSGPLPTFDSFEARKLVSALDTLDPDQLPSVEPASCLYYHWIECGMAIHSLNWGDDGLAIFDKWSQGSRYYDAEGSIVEGVTGFCECDFDMEGY